jgi:hypothetical protein
LAHIFPVLVSWTNKNLATLTPDIYYKPMSDRIPFPMVCSSGDEEDGLGALLAAHGIVCKGK